MQSILGAGLIELAALCWHSSGGNVCTCEGYRQNEILDKAAAEVGEGSVLPTEVGQASEAGD